MKLRAGDKVIVIAGKDKGHIGVLKEVNLKNNTVIVEGAGMKTYTTKPTQELPEGALERKEGPIHASNVMYFTETSNKEEGAIVSRIGIKIEKDNKTGRNRKVRFLKKTGVNI
jgi:large subunit ribosomal protein L24